MPGGVLRVSCAVTCLHHASCVLVMPRPVLVGCHAVQALEVAVAALCKVRHRRQPGGSCVGCTVCGRGPLRPSAPPALRHTLAPCDRLGACCGPIGDTAPKWNRVRVKTAPFPCTGMHTLLRHLSLPLKASALSPCHHMVFGVFACPGPRGATAGAARPPACVCGVACAGD